jgi:hypothetical protein
MTFFRNAALGVAIAAGTLVGGAARADCLEEYVPLPAADVSFARRAVPAMAAALKPPPAGWGKYKYNVPPVQDSVGYCEGLEDKPKAPKAKLRVSASYRPLATPDISYKISLTANEPPPKEPNAAVTYVTLGSMAQAVRGRVGLIRIGFGSNNQLPVPEADLAMLKSMVDMPALQALIAGKVPTQEAAEASLAQNKEQSDTAMAAIEAENRAKPKAQASRSSSKPAPSQSGTGSGNSGSGNGNSGSIPPVIPSILRSRFPRPF